MGRHGRAAEASRLVGPPFWWLFWKVLLHSVPLTQVAQSPELVTSSGQILLGQMWAQEPDQQAPELWGALCSDVSAPLAPIP